MGEAETDFGRKQYWESRGEMAALEFQDPFVLVVHLSICLFMSCIYSTPSQISVN